MTQPSHIPVRRPLRLLAFPVVAAGLYASGPAPMDWLKTRVVNVEAHDLTKSARIHAAAAAEASALAREGAGAWRTEALELGASAEMARQNVVLYTDAARYAAAAGDLATANRFLRDAYGWENDTARAAKFGRIAARLARSTAKSLSAAKG